MPVRVTVDRQRCRGNGICALYYPDVFLLDDAGFALSPGVVDERFADQIQGAIDNCPAHAIAVEPL